MKYLRNPEFRASVWAFSVISLLAAGLSFNFFGVPAGIFVLCVCLLLGIVHLHITVRRYDAIASLSLELDHILHCTNLLVVSECEEGELSILRSEIHKLTVRMRDQAAQLAQDKRYLADAMADVSHQLRTPLTSLNLIASLLSAPDLTTERRMTLCMDMSRLLSRLDWLISALLMMSKIDAGTASFKAEPVSVKELVKLASEPLEIPMELREIHFSVDIQGNECYTGDLQWSVEALGNILKNAMEHTPVGGEIHVVCVENAIFTELVVSDNGPGIDPEDLPNLFQRFYRGKNASSESVGIGLALAQMIISAQNGTIKAVNSAYGGAKFIIRFYKAIV